MKRVLFVSRVSLFPAEHGGAKSVRSIVQKLTREGVECQVLVRMHPPAPLRMRFAGQREEDLAGVVRDGLSWSHEGAHYLGVPGDNGELARRCEAEIERFKPDAVVLSDDALDDATALFRIGADSGRLLFLATTIHCLPFGPFSIGPSPGIAASIARAARIVAPSRYVAGYIEKHLGRAASVHYADVFGAGPFPELGRHTNRFITMINPCAWKGSSIFLDLARARPELEFAAVPTWGATDAIVRELKSLTNVTILEETPEIDRIFAQTRVLLAPSLCQEAFGLVSPEALLRGVPVVASDIAGLRESTVGAAELVPVSPMPFDRPPVGTGPHDFVWHVPPNAVEPWSRALDRIIGDEREYERISRAGRLAATDFVKTLGAQRFL